MLTWRSCCVRVQVRTAGDCCCLCRLCHDARHTQPAWSHVSPAPPMMAAAVCTSTSLLHQRPCICVLAWPPHIRGQLNRAKSGRGLSCVCVRSSHLSAMLMLVVAASFMARVSSDSLLLSSPTGVTSKNATSCNTSCRGAGSTQGCTQAAEETERVCNKSPQHVHTPQAAKQPKQTSEHWDSCSKDAWHKSLEVRGCCVEPCKPRHLPAMWAIPWRTAARAACTSPSLLQR